MLKGSRIGVLRRMQPVSIHGQISYDVFFTDFDDAGGQVHVARLGPEAVAQALEPGDRIQVRNGLLYVNEDQQDLHDVLGTDERPLNGIAMSELCPGSKALEGINARLR